MFLLKRLKTHFRFNLNHIILLNMHFSLCFSQSLGDDHSQTPLDVVADGSFLKLVWDGGVEHYARHWECPDGIWSEDILLRNPPKCACVKGAYLVSKSLCDEEFEILTGDNHCFDVSRTGARKFTPLTGRSGLKGKANTVFRRDAPYAARLVSPTPTTTVNEPVNYLFRLNDPNDFSVYATLPDGSGARLSCFKGQANGSDPIMQIAELPECSSDFRGPKEWCGKEGMPYGSYVTSIKVGSKWGPKSSGSGTKDSCPGASKKGRRKKRATPIKKSTSSSISTGNCLNFNESLIELPSQLGTPAVEYFVDRNEYPVHEFHTDSLHQSEINDQTLSVVKDLVDMHLGAKEAKTSVKVRIQNPSEIPAFKFIQLARVIMERVCPQEYIPSFVLSFITRFFRLIHLDTVQKHPYPEHLESEGVTNTKILEALTSCRDNIPDNITSFLPNETCPGAGYTGASLTGGQIYLLGTNWSAMPENIRFDPSSMDMSLETVYKMMMLVHYYCTPNFTSPLYHSEFAVKYEGFFNNPTLLYRWYHPGPSNTVLRMILSAFKLRNFAASIDRCVATANAMSAYKGWLRRPSDALKWKPRYTPVDEGLPTMEANTVHRRRKRYYFQNNIWDEKAYCLKNSKDITSEVRSSSAIGCRNRPAWFQNTD